VGKRGGDRRHAAPGRGNPMNLTIGCGMQQAREPPGGGSRRGRGKRRGRNEQGAGRHHAEAGVSSREWTPEGMPMERRSLREPYGRRSASASRAAVRCVSDSGCASTRRVVRISFPTARLRGTTAPGHSFTHGCPRGSSPGKATRPGTLRGEVVPSHERTVDCGW